MKVLIGITSKNRASILPKAINSALEQDYVNKVVAVYDDASTDGTAQLESEFPDVKWIISGTAKGLMFARNLFLDISDADFFCSLDDDAWFLSKDTLSIAIDYMKKNPNTAAIAFDILSPDDVSKEKKHAIEAVETNQYIGCGHLLRIPVIKQIGRYLESPGFYGGEEKDLCIRLINAGYSITKLKGLYVWHDKTTIARNLIKQHQSGVCNDLVFTYRRTPTVLLLPSFFVKMYKHLNFSITNGLLLACLKGFADFFAALFKLKMKHQPVSISSFKRYLKFNK